MKRAFKFAMPFLQGSLVKQIMVALILGVALAFVSPSIAKAVGFLGTVFVSALKAVAPILVFILVMASIANQNISTEKGHVKTILALYAVGTFAAACVAVLLSFMFPTQITLVTDAATVSAPGGVWDVLRNVILNVVDNPVHALLNGNYIGILAWAVAMGLVLRKAAPATLDVLNDASKAVEFVVRVVIRFAPVGIFGLVSSTLATAGFEVMYGYLQLLAVLLGAMFIVALVINPLLVWICTRQNPYPLTLQTLRESGIPAFFTRSSAANIPVNMDLCRRLNLPESTYSVSIPVGATINMSGAAITITVLALSAAYSLGVQVDVGTAIFLSFVASVCAMGASGVPGGSLMLIPLACGLFGIDQGTAMQVVAVGFIIGVLQDSAETGLNSSSDVLFTAAACLRKK